MPERDAVREPLVRVIRDADAAKMGDTPVVKLCNALGINTGSTHTEIADALLSRAQPEGEAVACSNPHNETSDPNRHCWHARETCCHCEASRDVAAPRPEPGEPTEAMVEAAYAVMRDQYRDKALISITAVREALTAALAAARGEGA